MGMLIIMAVLCLLSGPIALIISIVALNKVKESSGLVGKKTVPPVPFEEVEAPAYETMEQPLAPQPTPARPITPAEPVAPTVPFEQPKQTFKRLFVPAPQVIVEPTLEKTKKEAVSLEQKIGTRWILIAGIITSIVGVGFFLKYAYDNDMVGPLGRVVIAAVAGLIALIVGEVTRRRGYGIAAKGVTALGFAILYAAVFSAYRFYGLIGSPATFILAILITASAMLYAVALDEIIIAFFSLLGGFLTPVLVSTGENRPMALFSYVLVLSIGAILCAYYRKWRAVTVLAFFGTFVLYTGWFEKFYRHTMFEADTPKQITIALGWLTVFFTVYLVLPVFYGLVKKVTARREDVAQVLANACVTFYYLWTILFAKFRTELAFCAVGLCLAHLVLMVVTTKRLKEDIDLRLSLLVIGLFFLTIAIPLYLKMYAVAIAWAAEGVVLTIIGLRYRSLWTQAAGIIALILSLGQLLYHLPMHTAAFQVVFNPVLGSWCFAAAAFLACHIIYRKKKTEWDPDDLISQALYAAAGLLLFAAITMEWYWHCSFNNIVPGFVLQQFIKGMILFLSAFTLLLILRPVCPKGILLRVIATAFALNAAIFTIVDFPEIYRRSFPIFLNIEFAVALAFVVVLFASAMLIKQRISENKSEIIFAITFAIAGVLALWVLLSEEIYLYWQCKNLYAGPVENWQFLANMYTSIAWAIYGIALLVAGFWRNIKTLRFAALGLFAVLLVKVFIMDMSTVKNVYRIAAFLATGLALVAVSYLYQYLKSRGFFEIRPAQQNPPLNRENPND